MGDTEVRAAAMGSKDVEDNSQEPVEIVRPSQNPEMKYKDMESVEVRYGNTGGLMLQEAVFEDTGATCNYNTVSLS